MLCSSVQCAVCNGLVYGSKGAVIFVSIPKNIVVYDNSLRESRSKQYQGHSLLRTSAGARNMEKLNNGRIRSACFFQK